MKAALCILAIFAFFLVLGLIGGITTESPATGERHGNLFAYAARVKACNQTPGSNTHPFRASWT
ncbi:hypothetical protein [Burkholderia glumae]